MGGRLVWAWRAFSDSHYDLSWSVARLGPINGVPSRIGDDSVDRTGPLALDVPDGTIRSALTISDRRPAAKLRDGE